jgi:uncharacterized protein
MEACATSHYWARELAKFGHTVKLMPPAYVKPYVKRGKNDATDAEAICEAVSGGVLVAAATMPAHAASFDCAKAHKTDEAAICKNPDLSELDTEMGALWFAYSRVPFLMGSNAARHDDANDFLGKRSACGGDLACLRPLYQARIHALKEDIDRAMNNVLRGRE